MEQEICKQHKVFKKVFSAKLKFPLTLFRLVSKGLPSQFLPSNLSKRKS